MKRISVIFLVFLLCFLFCIPSFAEENNEATAETGTVTFIVEVNKNRPKDFDNYNCFVEINSEALNLASPTEGIFNIMSYSDYSATYELPYGTYQVIRGGVIGDSFGKFSMSPDVEEFVLSSENNNVIVKLNFDNMDHTTGNKIDDEKIVENYTEYMPEPEKEDYSNIFVMVGIFSVILAVVIVFCLIILFSVKKYKREM